MPRILCVGTATLDIINSVDRYPEEDSEARAQVQEVRRGGNAANTAAVLAQLGDDVAWVGNLSDRPEAQQVRDDFVRHGVDASRAALIPGGHMPTSYVTLSRATGSRTIVHYRDLPEYAAEAFSGLDPGAFDWIHFEGRAVEQLRQMIACAREHSGLRVSLEVEKQRDGIESLLAQPDLLMFGRDYVLSRGMDNAEDFLRSLPSGPAATCTWGEQGAWARDARGAILHADAYQPDRVVDTLGAGDVFNAGLVHAFSRGMTLQRALHEATRLAGAQCGREGLVL